MAELNQVPGHKYPFLSYDGMMYYYHSTMKGHTYWKCRKYPEYKIRATTEDGKVNVFNLFSGTDIKA